MKKLLSIVFSLFLFSSTAFAGGGVLPPAPSSAGGSGGANIACLAPKVKQISSHQTEGNWQIYVDFWLQQRTDLWNRSTENIPVSVLDKSGESLEFSFEFEPIAMSLFRSKITILSTTDQVTVRLPHLDPERETCFQEVDINLADNNILNNGLPGKYAHKSIAVEFLKSHFGQSNQLGKAVLDFDGTPQLTSKRKISRDIATQLGTINLEDNFRTHYYRASEAGIFDLPDYPQSPITWNELLRLIEFFDQSAL